MAPLMEEDVYRGKVRFNGQELDAEIIIKYAEDTFIGTGLLTGKVLLINFATHEVIIWDHTKLVICPLSFAKDQGPRTKD